MSTFESQTGKLAPQSILIKRYLILQVAGRGGMSAIYQAIDMQMDQKRVAIKEMSQENLDDEERQEAMIRFQQEANLLRLLQHSNLPRIYNAFGAGGRSFLVMDYINGKTLLQLLHEAGQPLPTEQVLRYADQLCDVLTYLHKQNPPVIFRDLKPTNVMVTSEGHVYLIDFGIARIFKEGQPMDTTILGSPGYAPPEQHGTGQTNPRSDLYALGATLHCCLTNQDPYHATDRFSFAPVRLFNHYVPPALDQLIMRLLSLDETRRPASAQEVKLALNRIYQEMQQQRTSAHMPAVTSQGSAPTQYARQPQPVHQATQMAQGITAEPQGRLILPATTASPTPPIYGQSPPPPAQQGLKYPQKQPSAPSAPPRSARTAVWTPGFVLIFLLILAITLGGSIFSFMIAQPYPNNPAASLTHTTEAALSALALILAFIMLILTRSFIAIILTLLNGIAILGFGTIFLLQSLLDIKLQPPPVILQQLQTIPFNPVITYALLGAGVVSLFWLFRPAFAWGDRIWILLLFGIVCTCAYLQSSYPDSGPGTIIKHLLLLGALITLIQGILTTGQIERKRRRV